jgi:hypothetical protein
MPDLFQQDTALATRPAQTAIAPMSLPQMLQLSLQSALDSGQGLEVVDRILAQVATQRDYEDRDRFNASLLRIQKQLKRIAKRGWNDSTKSWFAKSEDVDAEIQGLMQQEGMSLSFEPELNDQPNMVTIVGILSQGAYFRRYPLPMPCDGQGAKGGGVMTRTHATGSAITYAKRYLKNMIFDLGFKEKDDDGNGASGHKAPVGQLDEKEVIRHTENITNAGDMKELERLYLAARKAAKDAGEFDLGIAFDRRKNDRIAQLRKEGRG